MAKLLLEHHGKDMLRKGGIATPPGELVHDATGVTLERLGLGSPVVIKAQVPVGDRGKAGGIRVAESDRALHAAIAGILGQPMFGHLPAAVLIEPQVAFLAERYAGISITEGRLVLMFGAHGGVNVEEESATDVGNMAMLPVDPVAGIDAGGVRACLRRLALPEALDDGYLELACRLLAIARERDATLVEINPLVETHDGRLLALDARIAVDEAALPRQAEVAAMLAEIPQAAAVHPGTSLVTIRANPNGGTIGLIGLGGGLNLTIVDWVAGAGSGIHSLADIDSAIAAGRAAEAFASLFSAYDSEPQIGAILINVITAGYRLDDIVAALVPSLRGRIAAGSKPVVLHLYGNAMEQTPALLATAGFDNSASLQDAIARAVDAAGD